MDVAGLQGPETAAVAELADAQASGACALMGVKVQLLSAALPTCSPLNPYARTAQAAILVSARRDEPARRLRRGNVAQPPSAVQDDLDSSVCHWREAPSTAGGHGRHVCEHAPDRTSPPLAAGPNTAVASMRPDAAVTRQPR